MDYNIAGRLEVMQSLISKVDEYIKDFLQPAEKIWQPSDFLPDSRNESFIDEVKLLREAAKELPYDYWVVLIGDTITEEALPSYESWFTSIEGIDTVNDPQGWAKWAKQWTAEENRHGDLLNKYLYLSGRVNMRAVEMSTQYLITDGFDIGTGRDPYRNFVYTSFQELATNISHRRTATLAKQNGNALLSKMCGVIAADEMRHARAYKTFVKQIFEIDPSEMMLAFADMMKKKIVMPAHLMSEFDGVKKNIYSQFSDAAQRIGVYTSKDYVAILESLLDEWKIATVSGLNGAAAKAQDYVLNLPDRLTKVAERIKLPELEYKFSWVNELSPKVILAKV
jgi:acyl-[acyl-carrier-protein] desaturase